jgi:DNA polymerase delta subunit 3
MLYEFHRLQNAKKPGTIHATYLLSGTKRAEEQELIHGAKDGEDEYMQSSPFVGGSKLELEEASGACSVLTITLVGEENLECMRFPISG